MATVTLRRSTRVSETAAALISSFKHDISESEPPSEVEAKVPRKRTRTKVKRESTVKSEDDIEDLSPPSNWRAQFDALVEFRRNGRPAPVDTMGCDIHEHIDPKTRRLHCLISLMLSAQCKDEANALVMATMKRTLPRGLMLDDLLEIEQEDLARLIRPAGMHNNKSKFIKRVAVILRDDYDGDIPDTAEGMMSLPGVGPKMAMLCMASAWDQTVGIGVDVHVHRITNLLGWVKTNAPEKTRYALESWLPRDLWREINHLLVGHGQLTCKPIGRRCSECPLSQEGPLRCPSVVIEKSPRKKVIKIETQIGASTSPGKMSYDARFPRSNGAKLETKLEQVKQEVDGETTIETHGVLTQTSGNHVKQSITTVETSPYFAVAVKEEVEQ